MTEPRSLVAVCPIRVSAGKRLRSLRAIPPYFSGQLGFDPVPLFPLFARGVFYSHTLSKSSLVVTAPKI